MSGDDCIDVCNEICSRLNSLGFDLGEDSDHEPIFNALSKCELVKIGEPDKTCDNCAFGDGCLVIVRDRPGRTCRNWTAKKITEVPPETGTFVILEWNGLGLDNLSIVLDVPDEDNPNGPDEPVGPKTFETRKEAEDWASENLAFEWKVVEL